MFGVAVFVVRCVLQQNTILKYLHQVKVEEGCKALPLID